MNYDLLRESFDRTSVRAIDAKPTFGDPQAHRMVGQGLLATWQAIDSQRRPSGHFVLDCLTSRIHSWIVSAVHMANVLAIHAPQGY
jgi:hypothetical protein